MIKVTLTSRTTGTPWSFSVESYDVAVRFAEYVDKAEPGEFIVDFEGEEE